MDSSIINRSANGDASLALCTSASPLILACSFLCVCVCALECCPWGTTTHAIKSSDIDGGHLCRPRQQNTLHFHPIHWSRPDIDAAPVREGENTGSMCNWQQRVRKDIARNSIMYCTNYRETGGGVDVEAPES